MFNESNRYITRGVNENIDIRLQLIMWSMIDKLKQEKKIKVDYLQVFNLRRDGSSIIIEHSQECPNYKKVYSILDEDIEFSGKEKIFVIDSEDYSTMLLAEEY